MSAHPARGPCVAPVALSAVGPTAVLLLSCPDQPGVVATVADFVWRNGGNIVHAEQHTDTTDGVFFQRIEFELDGFAFDRSELAEVFDPVARRFGMDVTIRFSDDRPRMAVLASTAPHCLVDLLGRSHAGELAADLTLVASNHADHEQLCGFFGVPFHHLPVRDDPTAQGTAMQQLLVDERIELVVLARYMRILSPEFVAAWPNRIINIHHSFLPAFVGAKPYHQAYDRGVKIIGATAHYATAELDQGPIICQEVTPVSHRDTPERLIRLGGDLEQTVLARAVRLHLERRVLTYANRTVIFD